MIIPEWVTDENRDRWVQRHIEQLNLSLRLANMANEDLEEQVRHWITKSEGDEGDSSPSPS